MSREHLTSEEISQEIIEGLGFPAASHLQGCRECQARLEEARQPLNHFRAAVIGWSEAEPAAAAHSPEWRSVANGRSWKLGRLIPGAGVAFAATLLVALMIGTGALHKPFPSKTVAKAPVSDAVLMEQVDAEVSEAVPDAMSPLTDLVAWDSTVNTSPVTAMKDETGSASPGNRGATKANKHN